MLQREVALAGANVPKLDCEVARGGSEDVFGRGVEQDLSNFSVAAWLVFPVFYRSRREQMESKVALPRVSSELAHRRYVGNHLSIRVQRKALGNLPDEDLAILRSRRDDVVVERVP